MRVLRRGAGDGGKRTRAIDAGTLARICSWDTAGSRSLAAQARARSRTPHIGQGGATNAHAEQKTFQGGRSVRGKGVGFTYYRAGARSEQNSRNQPTVRRADPPGAVEPRGYSEPGSGQQHCPAGILPRFGEELPLRGHPGFDAMVRTAPPRNGREGLAPGLPAADRAEPAASGRDTCGEGESHPPCR